MYLPATLATVLFVLANVLAQPHVVRPVPVADDPSYYDPIPDEVLERFEELYDQRKKLRQQIEQARQQGDDTATFDVQLAGVEAELQALGDVPEDSPQNLISHAAAGVIEEIGNRYRPYKGEGAAALDPERAGELVEYLYHDMGYGPANHSVQDFALTVMGEACRDPKTPPETRAFFRDSLVAYHTGGGGEGSPALKEMLTRALILSVPSNDEEGVQLIRRLGAETSAWYGQVGDEISVNAQKRVHKWTAAFEERVQEHQAVAAFPPDARAAVEALHELERGQIKDPGQLRELSERLTRSFGEEDLDDGAIASLLRSYYRMLRGTGTEVGPATVAFIEKDLIRIAQLPRLKDQLQWKHWKLWARAAGALASRASPGIKTFLATEEERLLDDREARKSEKVRAITFVRRRLTK